MRLRGEEAIIPATTRRTRGSGGREGTRGGVALADFVAAQIVRVYRRGAAGNMLCGAGGRPSWTDRDPTCSDSSCVVATSSEGLFGRLLLFSFGKRREVVRFAFLKKEC